MTESKKGCEACGDLTRGVPTCLADLECQDRYIQHMVNNSQGMANLNAADPAKFKQLILGRHTRYTGVTQMATKSEPREKKVKEPTFCEHCAEPTKGGKFDIGHDAKLKGILGRQALDGDKEAMLEIIVRGWPYPKGDIDGVEGEARALLKGNQDRQDWLDKRVEARIARFQKGQSLEDEYGEALERRRAKASTKKATPPARKTAAKPKSPNHKQPAMPKKARARKAS